MDIASIHIGSIIRERLDASGISYSEFASRLCCERNSLYYLFKQKSLDTDRLVKISNILGFDFLSLYSSHSVSGNPGTAERDDLALAIVVLNRKDIDDFKKQFPDAHILQR